MLVLSLVDLLLFLIGFFARREVLVPIGAILGRYFEVDAFVSLVFDPLGDGVVNVYVG